MRSTGAGHRAKQWPVAFFLFHVFFTFGFYFFRIFTFRSHFVIFAMIPPCLRVFLLRHADGDFSFQTFFDDFLSLWLGCDTPED